MRSTCFPSLGAAPVALLLMLLAACGGGGAESGSSGAQLANEIAQGYAADAQAMPVSAATALETATRSIEAALGVSSQSSVAIPCASGGSLTFTVSGGTPASRLNGVLDAGEVFDVTFSNCGGPTPGAVLDGSLTLSVAQYSATSADLTHAARALRLSNGGNRYTLDGSVREQRSSQGLGAGVRLTSRLTSPGLALQTLLGGRSATYELRSLDWTVVCTLDGHGALLTRTHQGSLTLAVNTPRRPNATLTVTTQGTLTLGSDGMSSQGSFSLATRDDRIVVTYGDTSVSLGLDIGNNGSIDRTWTLTRLFFHAEAG